MCRRSWKLVTFNDSLVVYLQRLARPSCFIKLLEELGAVGWVFTRGQTVRDVDERRRVLRCVDGHLRTSEIKLVLILRSALLPDFTLPAGILWWQSQPSRLFVCGQATRSSQALQSLIHWTLFMYLGKISRRSFVVDIGQALLC